MKRRIRLTPENGTRVGDQRPLVTLNVRSRFGDFVALPFCVDTGSDLTSLPVAFARQEGITIPRGEHARGTVSGLVGTVEHYRGVIHVRMFGEDFTWPCAFIESRGPTSRQPYGVLGRAGFVSAFNSCMKDPYVTIERRRNHLPLWQRILLAFVPSVARDHPWDEPL